MALEIHCNSCGELLLICKHAHGRYTERITIDPCPKCIKAAQQMRAADGACTCRKISISGVVTAVNLNGCPVHTPIDIPWRDHTNDPYESCPVCEPPSH